jgi:PKD repeat protein
MNNSKHLYFLIILLLYGMNGAFSQVFEEDFESFNDSDYLALNSSIWTTWSNSPGSSEDVRVRNNDFYSGSKSIYFESQFGNGPQDVVLPFGGLHNSGHFKLSSRWKVTGKTGAYFNLQGAASIGTTWALDVYFYDNGNFSAGNVSGTYPQDQWFEFVIDIDLDNNVWEILIDGTSMGSFSNGTNAVSFMDIYPLYADAKFWVDDVKYCINSSCLTDVSVETVSISPQPLCSDHFADVSVKVKNNGPETAKSIRLAMQIEGQSPVFKNILLNDLAINKDSTFNISNIFKTNLSGNSLNFRVFSALGDRNSTNDSMGIKINVQKAPTGSVISKGTVFQGIESFGGNEDLIEIYKTNTYELSPPDNLNNSNYPNLWTIDTVKVYTQYGQLVPSTYFQLIPPNNNNNALLTFTGHPDYLDSLLSFYVKIKNPLSGCDTLIIKQIRVVPTPEVNFSFQNNICFGDDVVFTNLTQIHSGNNTFQWYFGDGDSSDFRDPIHTYSKIGKFYVQLIAISYPYGIKKDTSIELTVNDIPNSDFKVINKCEGIPIEVINNSTSNTGSMTYDWDFGDFTAHSNAFEPKHQYNTFGSYYITLETTSNGCTSSLKKRANQFERPKSKFQVNSTTVCSKKPINFINQSTIGFGKIGSNWNFDDGIISTQFSPPHSFSQSGTYNVMLKAISEFGCVDSTEKTITALKTPNPTFSSNRYCSQTPTQYTNTTVEELPIQQYTWIFSDGSTSNLKNISKNWNKLGLGKVTLKAQYTNGCSDESSENFRVLLQPKVDFEINDICSGDEAKFSNLTYEEENGIQYKWDFGDGKFSILKHPNNLYPKTTTTSYTVSLVAWYNDICTDTLRKNIVVTEIPTCNFDIQNNGFLNLKFVPENPNYGSYQWTFGDGGGSQEVSPAYKYSYAGNFNVTLEITEADICKCSMTKRISANTSIDELETLKEVKIHPNPSSGQFTVTQVHDNLMKIEIMNALGEIIQTTKSNELNNTFDLSEFGSGIYSVMININGQTAVYKISVVL